MLKTIPSFLSLHHSSTAFLTRKIPDASIDRLKEPGMLLVKATNDLHVVSKEKRRKNKFCFDSQGVEDTEKCHLDTDLGKAVNAVDVKSRRMEKQKKHKPELVEIEDRKGSLNFEEAVKGKIKELNSLTDELSRKVEDVEKCKGVKKKKRKKEATDSVEQVELGINLVVIAKKSKNERQDSSNKRQELANADDLTKDLQEYPGGKDKKKDKKKQQKSTSAKLVEESIGVENSANMDLQKPDFHKESFAASELNSSVVEKTTHKKRKRSSKENSMDEKKVVADELKHTKLEVAEDTKEIGDHLALTNWKQSPVKRKRKAAQSNRDSHEPTETLSSDYLVKDEQKAITEELGGPQLANGNIEKNGNEGSAGPKSMNKEKHSSELKTVNAFQRVKVDRVLFADERLRDNSYWALDDSGTGYGAKAQEVLGQVRGRNFRHEKTKKKRGTYWGGQIDLQSHSIKFNYSDEE